MLFVVIIHGATAVTVSCRCQASGFVRNENRERECRGPALQCEEVDWHTHLFFCIKLK